MKKFLPFLVAIVGVFATIGVLFLLIRTDHVSVNPGAFDWRKIVGTTPPDAAQEEAV